MAKIIPFKAVRPTRENASLVTARSYDDYSAAELAAQLDFNPLSFLHVLNPAYQDPHRLSMERRYSTVHQKYSEFKEEGILIQDPTPCFYIHRMESKTRTFTGIIAGTSIADYKSDVIKKHEDTMQFRVETFKNYIKYSGFNTEPVLMTYPDDPVLSTWIANKTVLPADLDFITTRKDIHHLWKIDAASDVAFLQQSFAKMPHLYIADGHHRSASAEMLYDEQKENSDEIHEHFLSFLIAESDVRIYEYNRLIRDLNHLGKEDFLIKVAAKFDVESAGDQLTNPERKHRFGMYIDGEYYLLTAKKELQSAETPLDQLDAQYLYVNLLEPILGITDLRNDSRIEYRSGKHPLSELKEKVDDGEFRVAFVLFPITINEITAIADANQIMPPKSTYVEPKFRSGLVVYEL